MRKKWQDWIVNDPSIGAGKLVFKGTRITVEFVVERLADGWTQEMILENYPSLSPAHLAGFFEMIQDKMLVPNLDAVGS